MRSHYIVKEHPVNMAGLQVGKTERVYILGHPGHKEEIDKTAELIQKYYRAEIWISMGDEAEQDISELEPVLRQMNLVVVMAGRRLLSELEEATGIVLDLATNMHKRIMPIIMERGIENEFSLKYGYFHMLDFSNSDYESKVKDFIEQYVDQYINISKEPKSIEDFFHFRIFISYRKKDRKYLLSLVDKIRQWDEHIDTSIWYDDALIPGEDYNLQIHDSLLNSDVILLLVTPNLLESGNYVLINEYPESVKNGKTIIPIMMQKTDLESLRQSYQGIGDVIDNFDDLRTRLRKDRDLRAGMDRSLTADDLYYLSLGFISGKGTELNEKMAFRLLTLASQSGSVWAMAKLGKTLYDNGQAEYAVNWMEQALEEFCQMIQTDKKAQEQEFSILKTGSDLCERLFCIYIQKELYVRAHEVLKREMCIVRFGNKVGINSEQCNDNVLLVRLGMLYMNCGNMSLAIDSFRSAEEGLKNWYKYFHNGNTTKNLIELYTYYGTAIILGIQYGQIPVWQFQQALDCLEAAKDVLKDFSSIPSLVESNMQMVLLIAEGYHKIITLKKFFFTDYESIAEMMRREAEYLDFYGIRDECEKAFPLIDRFHL